MKKEKQEGLNGKIGLSGGIGAIGEKRANLPTIRPQYNDTRKINPSVSFNYRKRKTNLFLQGDLLNQKRLNKNEFSDRLYSDGTLINQQYQENRTQTALTLKSGVDIQLDKQNQFSFSALYSREAHIDRGDLPYFNNGTGERTRLWQFYEDEVNTAVTASASFTHQYLQPGHKLNIGINYTFHREDEKYWITNTLPSSTGNDHFALIADQNVTDFNIDYIRPLQHGRIETGAKLRWRFIPTDMQFFPGENSPMDIDAAGWAKYEEMIPALYGNYIYETQRFEIEGGLRIEYVDLRYDVNPNHNTYESDGYQYFQPFPNARVAYLFDESNRLSFFYNRRVDRPDEGDIRIFPKYDDPEILKVGNPALRPQFTQSFEVGYKKNWNDAYLYGALYHRLTNDIITRITTPATGSNLLYSIFQNAGDGMNTGIEMVFEQELSKAVKFSINANGYKNTISGFTVLNQYPEPVMFSAVEDENYSWNLKFNGLFHLASKTDLQMTAIYLAPDIVPQGHIGERYSVDVGIKRIIQKGKGEIFINGTDVFNTMRIEKKIRTESVHVTSIDYYETQIFRAGYSYKF
jgi:outer membrane receptor protein involved in Fe transport